MAEHFPDATKKVNFIRREAAKAKKIYSVERRELVVPVAEIDWIPPADVVARDCYDRILAENDTMRNQLAKVGKKVGDKMDDVRPVVRGKWYWNNYRYDWCCSNCSHSADHYIGNDDAYKEPSFKFCPHCGADMRESNLDTTKGDQL